MISGTAAEPAALPVEATAALRPTRTREAGRVVDISSGPLQVRLAQSAADVDAALALRYRIFYEKMGARPLPGMEQRRRDYDGFDEICDHLLVLDHSRGAGPEAVVGTYRLIRRAAAERFGTFYSAAEYDIAPLIAYPGEILELGRSCVDAGYRARPVMQLLWSGIATYVFHYDIALMFGCASLPGTDPAALDPMRTLAALPPLIKGYLRLGGFVGDGAVIDEQFNTTDVCIVVKTDLVAEKYSRHYERQSRETWAA